MSDWHIIAVLSLIGAASWLADWLSDRARAREDAAWEAGKRNIGRSRT